MKIKENWSQKKEYFRWKKFKWNKENHCMNVHNLTTFQFSEFKQCGKGVLSQRYCNQLVCQCKNWAILEANYNMVLNVLTFKTSYEHCVSISTTYHSRKTYCWCGSHKRAHSSTNMLIQSYLSEETTESKW